MLDDWGRLVAVLVGLTALVSAAAAWFTVAKNKAALEAQERLTGTLKDELALCNAKIERLAGEGVVKDEKIAALEEKSAFLESFASARSEVLAAHRAVEGVQSSLDDHHQHAMDHWGSLEVALRELHDDIGEALAKIHVALTKRGRRQDDKPGQNGGP